MLFTSIFLRQQLTLDLSHTDLPHPICGIVLGSVTGCVCVRFIGGSMRLSGDGIRRYRNSWMEPS